MYVEDFEGGTNAAIEPKDIFEMTSIAPKSLYKYIHKKGEQNEKNFILFLGDHWTIDVLFTGSFHWCGQTHFLYRN